MSDACVTHTAKGQKQYISHVVDKSSHCLQVESLTLYSTLIVSSVKVGMYFEEHILSQRSLSFSTLLFVAYNFLSKRIEVLIMFCNRPYNIT